jgi:hypothetical protein
MRRPGAATRTLLAGALLLGAVWAVLPAPSPPLYDGLAGPAQAYLYLDPPPGYHQTGQPAPASHPLTLTGGSSAAGFVNTVETPPQAQVLAADGTFSAPAGATSITLAVTPVRPPRPIPASLGRLAGNVYEVKATADVPGPVTVVAGHPVTVVLRGPTGTGNAPMARLAEGGTAWERVSSQPLGSAPDMVVTNTDRLGFFAITATAATATTGGTGSSGGSGSNVVLVVVAAAVVAVAVIGLATALVLRRSRRPAPPRSRRGKR